MYYWYCPCCGDRRKAGRGPTLVERREYCGLCIKDRAHPESSGPRDGIQEATDTHCIHGVRRRKG